MASEKGLYMPSSIAISDLQIVPKWLHPKNVGILSTSLHTGPAKLNTWVFFFVNENSNFNYISMGDLFMNMLTLRKKEMRKGTAMGGIRTHDKLIISHKLCYNNCPIITMMKKTNQPSHSTTFIFQVRTLRCRPLLKVTASRGNQTIHSYCCHKVKYQGSYDQENASISFVSSVLVY